MAKVDYYEIKRMNELLENYVEIIERHTIDICFCSQCEFAKPEDDLTEVDEGDLMYCKPCLESLIARNDVDRCKFCKEYHTMEFLSEKNGEIYCDQCIDIGSESESEEE